MVPAECDVIHLWAPPGEKEPVRPFVVTIGGNGKPDETFSRNTVFVSRKHAENHRSTSYVYNGIEPGEFQCDERRSDHFVFLAKASWKVKNLEGAISLSRRAGAKLEVLGSRSLPGNLHRLLPRIRGVRYHGMVGDREKREVLRNARGLLFPVRWHEPFGVALTEALASGCPVFGTPYGSLPEIVTPAVGVLSANGDELLAGMRRAMAGEYSPAVCRERVSQGFTAQQMAERYLDYYSQVVQSGSLSKTEPVTLPGFLAQELLPWNSG
jgi:glycosyltransferase involved in cell wall biosynthesis